MEMSLNKIIFTIYTHSNKLKCQRSSMKNVNKRKNLWVCIFKYIYVCVYIIGIRGTATLWKSVELDPST